MPEIAVLLAVIFVLAVANPDCNVVIAAVFAAISVSFAATPV